MPWSADNVTVVRAEIDVTDVRVPPGNKQVVWVLDADIFDADGKPHHRYAGERFTIPTGTTLAAFVNKLIINHLQQWAMQTVDAPTVSFGRIELPEPAAPKQPTPEEIKARAIATETQKLQALKAQAALDPRLVDATEIEAQVQAVLDVKLAKTDTITPATPASPLVP